MTTVTVDDYAPAPPPLGGLGWQPVRAAALGEGARWDDVSEEKQKHFDIIL